MKAKWSDRASSPVHPLLFAAFPVLLLWSNNLDQGVTLSQALIVLAAAMSFSVVVLFLLRLLLKDWSRSAVAASVVTILFLNLGRVGDLLGVDGGPLGALIVAGLLIISLATIVAVRRIRPPESLTRTLNVIGLVLIVLNVVPIVAVQRADAEEFRFRSITGRLDPSASGPQRDVYYVIFDRYAGSETLRDIYGFDNSGFYDWLSAHGFDVIEGALANYPGTSHSLASSLNMSYLDDLAEAQGVDSSAWTPIRQTLEDSAVARTFKAMGYKYEHIGSWWTPTAADPTADETHVYGVYTEFLGMFVNTTAIPAIQRLFRTPPSFDKEAWDRVHFQVRALEEIESDPAPTFTFAHFLLPHNPYVFRADGSFVTSDPNRPLAGAYIDQLRYTNTVIERIVTELQASPGPAPIIVIQSDEGPYPPAFDRTRDEQSLNWARASDRELGRKLLVLNAYYLPGDPTTGPSPSITPVNTFRMMLNGYFGGSLPLLPDRTYIFADSDHPYSFEDVTDHLRGRS
jgi:Sulfatase